MEPINTLDPNAGSNGVSTPAEGVRPEAELEAVEAALNAVDEEHEEEGEGEGDEKEAKPSRVQRRIKKLVEQRKEYSKYGKPADIDRALARLKQYEALEARVVREQEVEEQASRVQSGAAERATRLRELWDEANGQGSYDRLNRSAAAQEAIEDRINAEQAKQARERLASVLKDNAINPDPKILQTFEHMLSTYIQANPELLDKYRDPTTQAEAIDESFQFLRSNMIDPVLAVANAGTLSSIVERKNRALGSARGSSAGSYVTEDRPPADVLKDSKALNNWHKERASRMWDAAIAADEGDGA